MSFKQYICSAVLIGLCGFTLLCSAVDHYTLQPVPLDFLYFDGFLNVLNDKGQVIGTQGVVDNNGNTKGRHAVLWENGSTTDLGALGTGLDGNSDSNAVAINANGQVVGNSTIYDSDGSAKGSHAFRWSNGTMTDLGALGTDINGLSTSTAVAINASGQVVGNSMDHAFLWTDGAMQDIAPVGAEYTDSYGYHRSYAVDINDNGQVLLNSSVNYPDTPGDANHTIRFGSSRPLVWHNGVISQLSSFANVPPPYLSYDFSMVEFGSGVSISNNGVVLGEVDTTSDTNFIGAKEISVAMWLPGGSLNILKDPLENYSRSYVRQLKANALNQVVAYYIWDIAGVHPVWVPFFSMSGLSFERVPIPIYECNDIFGAWDGQIDINDKEQIVVSVGRCRSANPSSAFPDREVFIYQNDVATDLNTLIPANSGWELNGVYAINNVGQILVSGNKGYALLTPITKASCDANQDSKVDMADLSLIYAANRTANPAYDIDADGVVTVRDLRKCVLQCSKANCEP